MNATPHCAETPSPWRFCLAPMMQRTDRHFRYLVRLLAPHMRLYTEMITSGAILYGQRDRFLAFTPAEAPLAVQLGGSDPDELSRAAAIAADWGYREVNLNCGCPSDRVRSGAFGACLMREPARVAACLSAMRNALPPDVPVSVKLRLGVDELYSYDYFSDFVAIQMASGCEVFHIHARKAWLAGLSPRENREIPPLEYDWVYRLKREYPAITVVINGGITSVAEAEQHLAKVDGVMLGRHAYADPYGLGEIDRRLFAAPAQRASRAQIVEQYLEHVRAERRRGTHLKHMSRHLLHFFFGQPGARGWRRDLTERAATADAEADVIETALARLARAQRGTRSEPATL